MTIVLQQSMPAEIMPMLEEVTDAMGVDADPPEGMIIHVHFEQDGQARILDVWESEQAYETFRDNRLMPAMQKVLSEHGMEMPQQGPASSTAEVQRMVRGR